MAVAFYMYLFLCVISGIILGTADIYPDDWQFWAMMFCVCGAYACGE